MRSIIMGKICLLLSPELSLWFLQGNANHEDENKDGGENNSAF